MELKTTPVIGNGVYAVRGGGISPIFLDRWEWSDDLGTTKIQEMPCDQRVGVVRMGMRRVQGVQGVQGVVQVQGVEGVVRQGVGMVQGVTEVGNFFMDNFSKAFSKLFSTQVIWEHCMIKLKGITLEGEDGVVWDG